MIRRILPLPFALFLLVGCQTHPASTQLSPGPTLIYNTAGKGEFQKRVAELQQHGYSPDAARRKAGAEFASQAWQDDNANAWAYEQQREKRSRENEQMEQDLAKLDRD